MKGFNISYDIVTPESAEAGCTEDSGMHAEGLTFREAMDELRWHRGCEVEADSYPLQRPRWFTFIAADTDYATGAVTSYSLHIPEHITEASRQRIARIVGCYGAR